MDGSLHGPDLGPCWACRLAARTGRQQRVHPLPRLLTEACLTRLPLAGLLQLLAQRAKQGSRRGCRSCARHQLLATCRCAMIVCAERM